MRPLAPLTALLLAAFLAAPASAQKKEPPKQPFKADAEQAKALKPEKLEIMADGSVQYEGPPKVVLDKALLLKADLQLTGRSKLEYYQPTANPQFTSVEPAVLVQTLKGLLPFARAKALSSVEVGKKLRDWGVPASFNGRHLLNPDGTATYYGLMLYQSVGGDKDMIPKVSGERLSASLALFESAFSQAFEKSAPDVGAKDLERAAGMLTSQKPGETPLKLMNGAAYTAPADWKLQLAKNKGDAQAIAALNALEKTRYHKDKDLNTPPPPKPGETASKNAPPSQLSLHGLLSALDKLNGKPLTADQQEWLVKSFPMGETVWRMKAPELWRAGLSGEGVKVAVIDTGVGFHPDVDDRVKERKNLMRDRATAQYGDHATHVAGTILALAPKAELRSYRGIPESSWKENPRLRMEGDEAGMALMRAVDQAVADGNTVINMSLAGEGRPTGPLGDKIRAYAEKGVVFVIAAGNDGGEGPTGVDMPGNTPKVITVGSVDVNDRYSRYSSLGTVWDPANLTHWVKTVVMAPGQDIKSSKIGTADEPNQHQTMSGTSMATPHMAGLVTLLMEQAGIKFTDPAAKGAAVRGAVTGGGTPIGARDLPPDAHPDQNFVMVNPLAAHRRIRDLPSRAVAK